MPEDMFKRICKETIKSLAFDYLAGKKTKGTQNWSKVCIS